MSARPDGAQAGTRGLGLFFVPRQLEDGTVNEFIIRRLKDKIGTRSMASGECDFHGARAYHMGASDEGFENMMNLVINTSRLFNAAACMGIARRAYITARTYAEHRHAFGQPIIKYPLVQETLANVKAEVDACTSGMLHLAWLSDQNERGKADDNGQQFLRLALNLNKVRTAKSARWACVEGIEILGGNGAIESFSTLPRLLRDAIVFENWEGTHNTLQMQIMRDMQKYGVHEGFFAYLEKRLMDCRAADQAQVDSVREMIGKSKDALANLATLPPGAATLAMRPQMDRLAWIFYAVARLWERGQQENTAAVDDASLQQFIAHRVREEVDYSDSAVISRLRTLLQDS